MMSPEELKCLRRALVDGWKPDQTVEIRVSVLRSLLDTLEVEAIGTLSPDGLTASEKADIAEVCEKVLSWHYRSVAVQIDDELLSSPLVTVTIRAYSLWQRLVFDGIVLEMALADILNKVVRGRSIAVAVEMVR